MPPISLFMWHMDAGRTPMVMPKKYPFANFISKIMCIFLLSISYNACQKTLYEPIETDKPIVAILPFKSLNTQGYFPNLNKEMIDQLGSSLDIAIIDELTVLDALTRSKYRKEDPRNLTFIRDIGKYLKTNYVISGSYKTGTDSNDISGFIVDISSGSIIVNIKKSDPNSDELVRTFINDLLNDFRQRLPATTPTSSKKAVTESHDITQPKKISPSAEKSGEAISKTNEDEDFGWLAFIVKPMYSVIIYLDQYFNDLGYSVIIFALLLQMLFFLIFFRYRKKAHFLQPYIQRIMRDYADTPKLKQAKLMGLYKTHSFNPASGCIFFVFQIFLFIAIYYVFTKPVIFKNVSTFLWVRDFSAKDPYFILPIVGGVTLCIQILLQRHVPGGTQGEILIGGIFVAIVATVILIFLPAAMALVVFTFNFSSALQTAYEKRLNKMNLIGSAIPQLATLAVFIIIGYIYISPMEYGLKHKAIVAKALPTTSKAITKTLAPEHSIVQLINSLLVEKRWEEAITNIDSEIKMKPEDTRLKELKADVLYDFSVDMLESDAERYQAYTKLKEALVTCPDHEKCKFVLAHIYKELGEEELNNICIRKGPSEFYSIIRVVKKSDILLQKKDEISQKNWIPILENNEETGWIYEPLVDRVRFGAEAGQLQVIRKRARSEVLLYFEKALELNPGLKRNLLWIQYKNIIIPGAIVFIFLIGSVLIIRQIYKF